MGVLSWVMEQELVEEFNSRFDELGVAAARPLTKQAFISATWLCSQLHSQVSQEQTLDLLQQLWKTEIDTDDDNWELPTEVPSSFRQIMLQFSDILQHFPIPKYHPNTEDQQKIRRAQEQTQQLQSLEDLSGEPEPSEEESESMETPLPQKSKFQLLAEFSDEEEDETALGQVQVTQDDYAKWWAAVDVTHTVDDFDLDGADDLLEDPLDYETLGEEFESSLLKIARANRQARENKQSPRDSTLDDEETEPETLSDLDDDDLLKSSDDVDAALLDVLGSGLIRQSSKSNSRGQATAKASDRLLLHDDDVTLDNFDKLDLEMGSEDDASEADEEVEYEYVDEDGNPVEGPLGSDDDVQYEYVEVEDGANLSSEHEDLKSSVEEAEDLDDADFAELSFTKRNPKSFDWDSFLDSDD